MSGWSAQHLFILTRLKKVKREREVKEENLLVRWVQLIHSMLIFGILTPQWHHSVVAFRKQEEREGGCIIQQVEPNWGY